MKSIKAKLSNVYSAWSIVWFFCVSVIAYAVISVGCQLIYLGISKLTGIGDRYVEIVELVIYIFSIAALLLLNKKIMKSTLFFNNWHFSLDVWFVAVLFIIAAMWYLTTFDFKINVDSLTEIIMDLGAGTFEEIWFRGILLYALVRILKNHKYGILLALIISAVVFGSVHLLNSGASTKELMLNALSAGAGGLLLGSVYLKSKNLILPMFLHFIQDFSLAFFKPTFINQTTFTATILQVVLYLIAALILIRNLEPQKWLDSEVI